ncbi:hypothetical protein ACVRZS_06085 [Streptococcus ferus]|uniref:Uncharacterized protein n=2 Tax=Streptococcus ferus TaxID=1345 RepID=A0A2X3Y2Q9_9STRE|nr:hypothetical protein [Streptococcus ferus]SQF41112.1 Uncharacterised protein [Streptococcus ferus]
MDCLLGTSQALSDGDLGELEKTLEKQTVRILAGFYKGRPSTIKSTYKQKMAASAKAAKKTLKASAGALDQEVKGTFSTAIKTAVKEKATGYDKL